MPHPLRARLSLLIGGALLVAALPTGTAASAAPAGATLTVVHGVRGLVADVRLDDRLVLSGFAPERVTDPLPLTAGAHHLQLWRSGAPSTDTPLVDQQIEVSAGERATAGVGLSADGSPVVTVFDDRPLLPTAGSTALAVRGLAKADPMRVVAGDVTVAPSLGPTQQAVQQVPAGSYPVTVVPADGSDPLIPAQDVPLAAGRATVLYLIGSQTDGTLGWVAQTVLPGTAAAPGRVDTGVGPVPTPQRAAPLGLLAALAVTLLAALSWRARASQR